MGRYAVDGEEADTTSTLSMYRRANRLRKKLQSTETLEWVGGKANVHLLHFRRPGGWEVILNTGETPVKMPSGTVLINSTMKEINGELPGYTTVWLQR